MSENLLPCPFCGSVVAPMVLDENQMLYIECKDCDYGVSSNPYYQVVCRHGLPYMGSRLIGCGASGGLRSTKDTAIEAWNERAVKLNMSVEKLAEVLVKIDDDENPLGYCKSDCEEVDGCPHPVECCVKWLMGGLAP